MVSPPNHTLETSDKKHTEYMDCIAIYTLRRVFSFICNTSNVYSFCSDTDFGQFQSTIKVMNKIHEQK